MTLLGRGHQGSPEAEDTLTMISHGVEISIAGGGADEKDDFGNQLAPSLSLRCTSHRSLKHALQCMAA